MLLASGSRLGPYEIASPLGAGGMGEVYRAHDPRLDRDVAIKILPSAFAADPDRLRRFEQEARAAAALNHPNILAVYDIGQHDGAPYIVSELLEGETLREVLAEGSGLKTQGHLQRDGGSGPKPEAVSPKSGRLFEPRPLPVRKAVEYGVQIVHGLAAAHEKAIVHRDLKPENIFITSDNRVKILDFGLAKLTETEPALAGSRVPTTPAFDHAQAGLATEPGMALGTIGYMAPEQVRGLAVDHRADIFALGAVLYEMLSGRRAFTGETAADTMTAILKEDPADLSTAARGVPPALQRIVDRCLEKNPAARFQSTSDLSFALESLSSLSRSAEAATPPSVPAVRTRRAMLLRVAAVAAFAVLLPLAFLLGTRIRGGAPPLGAPAARFVFQPVETRLPSSPFAFAPVAPIVSPDGRWIVFVGNSPRGATLWIRDNRSAAIKELPGTFDARAPFWSPDSRYIGFTADQKLKRVEIGGTAPETVCPLPSGAGGAVEGSWSAEDTIIFSSPGLSGLFRASGGAPVSLTRRNEALKETQHRFPQFLPDGRRFLFLIRSGYPDHTGVYVGSLDGSEPVRVLNVDAAARYVPPNYLLFVRQQRVVAQIFDPRTLAVQAEPVPLLDGAQANSLSTSDNGVLSYVNPQAANSRLTWVDRSGHEQESIGEPGSYPTFDLSKDANRLVVTRTQPDGSQNLWVVDLLRGSMSRLTLQEASHTDPRWSPDGREVIFGSTADPARSPFQVSLSAQNAVQVFKFDGRLFSLDDWSPDGRNLVYHDAGVPALWARSPAGDGKPMLIARALSGTVDQAQFSVDGRWLAYNVNESGRYEVYVVPFPPTGDKWQVSTAGGVQPTWRGDGRELYFLAPDGTLMAVDVRPSATFEWGNARPLFKSQIDSLSFQTEQYAPAPDGKRFLFVKPIEGAAPPSATIVVNWPALLKQ